MSEVGPLAIKGIADVLAFWVFGWKVVHRPPFGLWAGPPSEAWDAGWRE